MPSIRLMIIFAALCAATACDRTRVTGTFDAGLKCQDHERVINGECRFVCQRDGECMSGERCNLFTGRCEAKPPGPDAGPVTTPCTRGAERCTSDTKAIERCAADGTWGVFQTCATPSGFCLNEKCLACQPGLASCVMGQTNQVQVCKDDGSGFRTFNCAGAASCTQGECRECTPNATRCSPDSKSVQTCTRQADETLTWKWVNSGDNFDGTCVTQTCELNGQGVAACHPPDCVPGSATCKSSTVQSVCGATGTPSDVTCSSLPGMGPNAECQNGVCFDECADAVKAKSYFGCEYWSAVQDNSVSATPFKAGTTSGQGALASKSEFAFVVANRSLSPATVNVTRIFGGATQTVATVTVPSRTDGATKGLAVIRVPWQSIGPASTTAPMSYSGLAKYGYRLVSTKPVSVYQFNPLSASVNGTFSYSNDASLLLPIHILGTSYVGITPEFVTVRASNSTGAPVAGRGFNSHLTIVAPEDGTTVSIKSSATIKAGTGIAATAKGGTLTLTLNAYDVAQIATTEPPGLSGSATGNLEACKDDPYDPLSCLFGCDKFCRVDSDLTGTIVTANKPVAVFGGSSCTVRGFADTACDHVEEQLFPFVTWGKSFVATRTAPLRLTDNTFASAANAGPDYYKIVAGCPDSQCPNGTSITLSVAPAAGDVLSSASGNGCIAGTSLTANTCRLRGGAFVEFKSKTSFTIGSDFPIEVAQLFAGQDATGGTTRPAQGDPSLVLLPPVEQWRPNYTVLTAPGTKDNYLGLVIDGTKVQRVEVDGAPAAGFTAIGATPFKQVNLPVATGTHTIVVVPNPGVSPIPGAGVTVYGFDQYVSYGYTGGLDLQSIVTGITPGG
ncbi:MAG: IgGFc-binding protein [Myxococcaceae bacterium]|nr:IgGFc-binding protein [Myxococcaceae bacterium]